MDLLPIIQPTSKAALKQQCMILAQGDVQKAREIYNFYAEGLALPDFDPVKPSAFEGFKDNAVSFVGWLKENQDTVVQGVDFIRGLIRNRASAGTVVEEAVNALPEINE